MGDAESKAAGFNSTVAMLRQMVGAEKMREIEAALPKETVELLRHPPVPVEWIPNRHVRALQTTAVRVGFDGDVRKMVELSCRARLADLGTIYRYFVRLASVEFAVSRAAKMYGTYTRENGTLEVSARGERFVELSFKGLHDPSPAAWAYCEGAIKAVVEMTGLEGASIHAVRGGGVTHDCTYRISWAR